MPLISEERQKPYLRELRLLVQTLLKGSIFDAEKDLAFCIWYLLFNAIKVPRDMGKQDPVIETIHALGVLDDVRLTFWDYKGSPLEAQAMAKRFNDS